MCDGEGGVKVSFRSYSACCAEVRRGRPVTKAPEALLPKDDGHVDRGGGGRGGNKRPHLKNGRDLVEV